MDIPSLQGYTDITSVLECMDSPSLLGYTDITSVPQCRGIPSLLGYTVLECMAIPSVLEEIWILNEYPDMPETAPLQRETHRETERERRTGRIFTEVVITRLAGAT